MFSLAMLSGQPPFHPNFNAQITKSTYYPMTGPSWDNISADAKDLIRRMLTKDYGARIALHEVGDCSVPMCNLAPPLN